MPQNALQQWLASNPNNEAVSAAANDLFFNNLSAQFQTRSDVNYAQQMMPLALEFQREAQRIATSGDLATIGAQGQIATDIANINARSNVDIANIGARSNVDVAGIQAGAVTQAAGIQADASRDIARTNLIGTLYQADAGLASTAIAADSQVRTGLIDAESRVRTTQIGADAQRFVADRQLDQTKVGADAQRFVADRQLDGVRDTNRSQETQIGLRGAEDRRTLTQGTDETLRLRSDARGAIQKAGSRFFG